MLCILIIIIILVIIIQFIYRLLKTVKSAECQVKIKSQILVKTLFEMDTKHKTIKNK